MRRRRFVLGLGALTAGAAAVGTGAFSTVEADRSVTVNVEEDYDAYLALEEVGRGGRSELDGGELTLDIPGESEDEYGGTDPAGVGTDSIYRFGSDASGDPGDGLFTVTNHGTQPVSVYSSQTQTEGVPEVTIYDVGTGRLLTETTPSDVLALGETLRCGIEVDTHGVDIREMDYDVTLTITAVADR